MSDYFKECEEYQPKNSAVGFALDVLDMQAEIDWLRKEVERLSKYEEKYNDQLSSDLKNAKQTSASILNLLLTPEAEKSFQKK
jgi:hypothetical protein